MRQHPNSHREAKATAAVLDSTHLAYFVSRRGGATGSERNRVGLRGGRAGSAPVPSADDDQDFDLWLLCRGVFLAPDAEEVERGCRFSGVGSGERTGFPNDLGFSEAASEGAARVI